MKFIFIVMAFALSFSASATDVAGQLFYVDNADQLVQRDVVIDVPSRGQGEVVLKGQRFEWRTENFWSTETEAGQKIFTAVFQTDFMGRQSTIALRGTYLRGENQLVFNGNFFKKEGHDPVEGDISGLRYSGGFTFSYIR